MTLFMLFATVATGFGSVHVAFGFQFAFFVLLAAVHAAIVLYYLRRDLVLAALALLVSAIFVSAAVLERYEAKGANATVSLPVVAVATGTARAQAAGEKLFRDLGCVECHRPDGRGVGPALTGVFGRPATAPACGALTVDDEYVRESILNPSAVVAAEIVPVMPAFAGVVTEEELRSLTAYVKSLSGR
jgi:mono/diheme cytochrome c family protein